MTSSSFCGVTTVSATAYATPAATAVAKLSRMRSPSARRKAANCVCEELETASAESDRRLANRATPAAQPRVASSAPRVTA